MGINISCDHKEVTTMNIINKFLRTKVAIPLLTLAVLVTSLWPYDTQALTFPSGWVSTYSTNEVYYRVHDVNTGWQQYRTGTYTDFLNSGFIDGIEFMNTNQGPLTIPENSIWTISFVSENCSFEGTTNNLSSNYGRFMGMDTETTGYEYVTYYFYNNGPSLEGEFYTLPISVNCQANSRFKATTFYSFVKLDVSEGQLDYTSVLNDIKDAIDAHDANVDAWFSNIDEDIAGAADAIVEQTEAEQERYEEQQTNVTNAQTDADTNSQESSSNAESVGSSLLDILRSFVGVLTSANDNVNNNCTFSGNMGNLNLGNLNFCALSPPREFQFISSLVVIGFSVPLTIAMINKILSLFRGFA